MAAPKGRSQRLADFEERLAKDHDPEADGRVDGSDDSQSEDESDGGLDGTEHYVSVGKSKLRQTDPVSLGPQYRGKRVSRAALDDSSDNGEDDEDDEEEEEDDDDDDEEGEEFDDPETADLEADQQRVTSDEEIDSDAAFDESDRERFSKFTFRGSSHPAQPADLRRKKRPIAADFLSGSDSEGASDEEEQQARGSLNGIAELSDADDDEEDEEEEDDEDEDEDASDVGSDDEDDLDGASESDESDDNDADRAELRKIMSEGQKNIVATMTEAARADVDKGRAVRKQRQSFDTLLNIRIRLQKALVAANSLGAIPEGDDGNTTEEEPYQAAEEAALKLLSSIETFRHSLLPEPSSSSSTATEGAGQKRKRDTPAVGTSLEELWEDMQVVESRAASHRRKVLEKWSNKVRSTTAATTTRKLGGAPAQSLTSVLDDQLVSSSDRLVGRTRVPRSCAPVQATANGKSSVEVAGVFDDADFYQLLLKELVDQRTADPSGGGPGASADSSTGLGAAAVPTVRWATAAAREARTRKVVDRRASKGRKLRFTVHEKLQNFMAPEDRRAWEQDAIDRFFGTLFGQKMEVLREDVDDGAASDEDMEMGGASLEEQGLRLFRS